MNNEDLKWISPKREKPKNVGPYLVSISLPVNNGDYVFRYVAEYNPETDVWYKFDPFDLSTKKEKEEIQGVVVGWIRDTSTFLG